MVLELPADYCLKERVAGFIFNTKELNIRETFDFQIEELRQVNNKPWSRDKLKHQFSLPNFNLLEETRNIVCFNTFMTTGYLDVHKALTKLLTFHA